jgi:hypothetical protein
VFGNNKKRKGAHLFSAEETEQAKLGGGLFSSPPFVAGGSFLSWCYRRQDEAKTVAKELSKWFVTMEINI